MVAGEMAGVEHRLAPVAFSDVEPHSACRIGHIAGVLAGHPQTQIIFWQQHLRHLAKNLGLVALDPQQFGCGKARHHQVAGDLPGCRHAFFQQGALFTAAAVIP